MISNLRQKYIKQLIFLQYRIEYAGFIGENEKIRIETEKEILLSVLKDLQSLKSNAKDAGSCINDFIK